MTYIADTHSHSIVSGHAYSTLKEMLEAGAEKKLRMMAVTEHAPNMPGTCGWYYFMNHDVIPRERYGIRLLFGAELNILDEEGNVDLSEEVCQDLDLVIASMHIPCFKGEKTIETVTKAYRAVMEKPYVNIIGHPDDGRFPVDYKQLVLDAKETHTLLELNNSSLRPESFREGGQEHMLTMLQYCKRYEVPITTGSDAHIDADVGNFRYIQPILEACEFPERLIATKNEELLKEYLNKKL